MLPAEGHPRRGPGVLREERDRRGGSASRVRARGRGRFELRARPLAPLGHGPPARRPRAHASHPAGRGPRGALTLSARRRGASDNPPARAAKCADETRGRRHPSRPPPSRRLHRPGDGAALREIGPVPMGVRRGGSAFAYLSRAILAQQISTAAARSIATAIDGPFRLAVAARARSGGERRRAARARPVAPEGVVPARPRGPHAKRPPARPAEPLERRARDRDAHRREGDWALDRRDVPDVPARPRRRAARGRPRHPLRDAPRLRHARAAEEGAHAPHRGGLEAVPLDRVLLPLDEPRRREAGSEEAAAEGPAPKADANAADNGSSSRASGGRAPLPRPRSRRRSTARPP